MKPCACVGIAVLDKVFRVNALPQQGGKYVAHQYAEIGGGPAATAAVAVARCGHPVDFIGRVGSDPSAKVITDELQQYGVGTDQVRRVAGAVSGLSAVLVDDQGERMIINHQDDKLDRSADWLNAIDFARYGAVLADVRWIAGAKAALNAARRAGVPTVLDADVTPEDISELVALADHVAFSQPGLARFTGTDSPEEGLRRARARTSGRVYVTLGSDGCLWLEGETLKHQPGFTVDVVDTTGAGDVFHGALLVAVAEGMATDQAVRFASGVAALKCTRLGGRAGIPDRAQIEQFLQS